MYIPGKVAHPVRNSKLFSLEYGPQSLNVYGFDALTKINVFYQLAQLSNNLLLIY